MNKSQFTSIITLLSVLIVIVLYQLVFPEKVDTKLNTHTKITTPKNKNNIESQSFNITLNDYEKIINKLNEIIDKQSILKVNLSKIESSIDNQSEIVSNLQVKKIESTQTEEITDEPSDTIRIEESRLAFEKMENLLLDNINDGVWEKEQDNIFKSEIENLNTEDRVKIMDMFIDNLNNGYIK